MYVNQKARVPLLLRMAKDVEENPGPTIYDLVDPNETIAADFSQGNSRKFRQNAGNLCVAMSLTAIIHTELKINKYINNWEYWTMNHFAFSTTVANIKSSEDSFKIFDSHSKDLYGISHPYGKCSVLLTVQGLENLSLDFQNTLVYTLVNTLVEIHCRCC
ncbi:LOW QUALITY PROTEIN: uncharacterized protein LOC124456134 [Xenia sp. Carnegie-2017]|uniref:LOW QUALITY PROTEIN: uncharacterized protein LOC124456134 n=1 Tax=Xenia sp. Carnegie-2017 TaxID=2897299 RepID=UPI001F04E3C6|nr:LOW QUALITY PROTEIN: uncharacterized protein LOC124456134 [Xenia sp. Carnegie-2017]